MADTLQTTLRTMLQTPELAGLDNIMRGIEKESLRITPAGTLAMTPHPTALGSALTHPHITTDYSEALLEFITPPSTDITQTLEQLTALHAYTYQQIGDERLWVTSMPCVLGKDDDIPIAQYGNSNSGKMKSVYRLGLGHRYGRAMQTIAGIHYNFSVSDELWQCLHQQQGSTLSLQDFKTQGYFKLIRNFRRYFWLLLYLFGASPGVCKSFLKGRDHALVPFRGDSHSLHQPFATSLRMGDLGYQSHAQDPLIITYNCLESYIKTLCCAITKTHPEYAQKGIKDSAGQYQQLSDSLLQIENEFYSVIRPKRTAKRGETALAALANGGIEYIEVRCLDLNPYEPIGINAQQSHFLDTFLLYCLLEDSPPSNDDEYHDIQQNQKRMVYNGRDPQLTLLDKGKLRPMRDWATELLSGLEHVAGLLDQTKQSHCYSDSVTDAKAKVADAALTPSARILKDMAEQDLSFYQFAAAMSEQHRQFFAHYPLGEQAQHLQELALTSLAQQQQLEHEDTLSFDEYLANYYSQYECANKAPANAE